MRRALQFAAFVLLATSAFGCGSERWDVKTLQDHYALVTSDPQLMTVGALRNLPRPRVLKQRTPTEALYVYVPAVLRGFKREADGDYHVVISAQNSAATMIAEVPDFTCANPDYAAQFQAVRAVLEALAKPKAVGKMTWLPKPVNVVVEGFVFFDKLHGQTGLAPNGIEIHPVLRIDKTTP